MIDPTGCDYELADGTLSDAADAHLGWRTRIAQACAQARVQEKEACAQVADREATLRDGSPYASGHFQACRDIAIGIRMRSSATILKELAVSRSEERPAYGWRPIDTAPRNGMPILLRCRGFVMSDCWMPGNPEYPQQGRWHNWPYLKGLMVSDEPEEWMDIPGGQSCHN